MRVGVDGAFALVAAVVVLVATAAVVAGSPTHATSSSVEFDAGVPADYAFEAPTADGTATVGGESYDSLQAAVAAAEPGQTVRVRGRFAERVVISTANLTIAPAAGAVAPPLLDGGGEGDVLTLDAPDVTVRGLWVRNSGYATSDNDAGIWVNGTGSRIVDSRVTGVTFGIWVDGVDDVRLRNNTIVGRESVTPLSRRGNGIQLWRTSDTVVEDNRITDARDGIYYSWASDVTARGNTMWDLRYGVHYMYSDDCRLANNTAFDNDVGYALMVSKRLEIVDNVAVNNTGGSGHGILVKSVDETTITGNELVANRNGLYVFNSLDNDISGNLLLANAVGIHLTAGSVRERVVGNGFIHNDRALVAVLSTQQVTWNDTERGNYWAGARTVDRNGDGISEVRHRPAGLAEYVLATHPRAAVFSHSPAFDVIRLAESTFPVVSAPGVVDHRPLTEPPHDDWRRYYGEEANQ